MVAHTAVSVSVGGIAFDYRAVDLIYHGSPEIWSQEVLVAFLSGVELNGYLARKLYAERIIHFYDHFRAQVPSEIYFRFHLLFSMRIRFREYLS
jgi:hypothetical protein